MEPDGQTDPVRVRSIVFEKLLGVLRQFGRGCDRAAFLLDRNCVSIQ